MKCSANVFLVALAGLFGSASVEAFERKIGSEERRLFGWSMSASDRQEHYASIYCRCCGNEEGFRNVSTTLVPLCADYEGQSCKCPVREETGSSWWNFFGTDFQAHWGESCSTTIMERANITFVIPPTTDAAIDGGLTIVASNLTEAEIGGALPILAKNGDV